jgi:hypothetical protein
MGIILEIIKGTMTFVRDAINVVTLAIQGDWGGAWEAVKTMTSNALGAI